MPKEDIKKEEKKAKKVAKVNKKGDKSKKRKIHTHIRFFRPHTLKLARNPRYEKCVSSAIK